jgi:hypothetical protein
VSLFAKQCQDLLEENKIALFAWTPERVLLKERDDPLPQFASVTYLEPVAESVIGPAIALDVDLAALEEVPQFIEQDAVGSDQLKAESRLDLCPTSLGLIEVDGKASLAIDQSQNIVGGQHQVSPFGRLCRRTMGQLTSYRVVMVPATIGSPGVTCWAISCIPKQGMVKCIFTVVHTQLDAPRNA